MLRRTVRVLCAALVVVLATVFLAVPVLWTLWAGGRRECGARTVLDRRRVCSGVDVLSEAAVIPVQFDRSLP